MESCERQEIAPIKNLERIDGRGGRIAQRKRERPDAGIGAGRFSLLSERVFLDRIDQRLWGAANGAHDGKENPEQFEALQNDCLHIGFPCGLWLAYLTAFQPLS
jgi:hypothetical protein